MESLERTVVHESSDHGRALQDGFRTRRQSVDPGRDQAAQSGWHHEAASVPCRNPSILLAPQNPFLDECTDDFLDEERIALGLLKNPTADPVRQLGDV